MSTKHLKGAPLPRKVIEHSVFFNSGAILFHRTGDASEAEAARHGLPQGARLSGTIASSLLGRELRRLDGTRGIVTYVDDVLIGACDPAGAKTLAEAIKMRFGKLPGGPLSFKLIKTASAEGGFSFLGYWIRLIEKEGEPFVSVKPSHEAYQKLRKRTYKRLRQLGAKLDWDMGVKRASSYLERWLKTYSYWKPTEQEVDEISARVETYVSDYLSNVPLKIKPALGKAAVIGHNPGTGYCELQEVGS